MTIDVGVTLGSGSEPSTCRVGPNQGNVTALAGDVDSQKAEHRLQRCKSVSVSRKQIQERIGEGSVRAKSAGEALWKSIGPLKSWS
jgi:hypothetical protein